MMITVVVMAQYIIATVFCVVTPCSLPHASEDCGFNVQLTENLASKQGSTILIAIWSMLLTIATTQ
jgi:hypothetical protein